jgi:sensor c-di-GMP phosphodiesterase-like protein
MRRLANAGICFTLTCLAAIVPVFTSVCIVNYVALERARHDLRQFAAKALIRSELVSRQAFGAVADIAHIPGDPCSKNGLKALSRINFNYRYVQDIGILSDGTYRCSLLLGHVDKVQWVLPAADWQSKDGYRIWFHQKNPLSVVRENILIGHDDMYASVDPQSYVDVVDLDHRPIANVNIDTGTVFAISSGVSAVDMLKAWKRGGKMDNGDWLYAVARSTTQPVAVVVRERRPVLFDQWSTPLGSWFFTGGAVGAILAGLTLRLLSRERTMPVLLKRAIRSRQIEMHYQPIVRLRDCACVGVEALVRWRLNGKYVPPDVFVPIAEERGFIRQLTELVLETIINDLASFLRTRPWFYVSINVSSADLQDERFLRFLTARVAMAGIRALQIRIEATERSFMDAQCTKQTIAAFRKAGHPVCIDDFGTGYSSLSYLQNFKVDVLKIDKVFVDAIAHKAATTSVVTPHIIAIGHALELEIVAEGIEHRAQAEYLSERGVQYGQGWWFGRPMAATALVEYLRLPNPLSQPPLFTPT